MSGVLQQFPSRNTTFADPKTGLVNPTWYNLQRALWLRTGGGVPTATAAELQAEITANTGLIHTNTAAIAALSVDVSTNYAPLASPHFSGTPTVPTASPGTNTTEAASTAFVQAAVTSATYTLPAATATVLGGVKPDDTTITNVSGAISVTYGTTAGTAAQGNDARITGALQATAAAATYAPLASPALTGTPTAPTATAGTSTTQIATTAFVATSYARLASPTFTGTVTGGGIITASKGGGAIAAVTVTASPFAYTAATRGALFVSGGTVSSISFKRGATTIPAGIVAGVVPVTNGDVVTITYIAAPTVNFVPD